MDTKYKCEKCSSESEGTCGMCCGSERSACEVEPSTDSKIENAEHSHAEGEECQSCSADQN